MRCAGDDKAQTPVGGLAVEMPTGTGELIAGTHVAREMSDRPGQRQGWAGKGIRGGVCRDAGDAGGACDWWTVRLDRRGKAARATGPFAWDVTCAISITACTCLIGYDAPPEGPRLACRWEMCDDIIRGNNGICKKRRRIFGNFGTQNSACISGNG